MSTPAPGPDGSEAPRAWWPLAVAAGVALLVVVGAVLASQLRQGYSPAEADAVRACEAAYAASGEQGEALPVIEAGDVYRAADWRDHHALLRQQGVLDVPVDQVPAEEAQARDDAAAALAREGRDHVTVVWWLSTQEHLVCEVDLEDGRALDASVELHPLRPLAPPA